MGLWGALHRGLDVVGDLPGLRHGRQYFHQRAFARARMEDRLFQGVFATAAVNAAGADGLLHGNASLLWAQVKAVAVTWVYAFVATFVILKVLDRLVGLRVAPDQEVEGLDLTQHSERAYVL